MVNGAKIKSLRESKGLTTIEFGGEVGLSDAMVSYIERGIKEPKVSTLKIIADFFGVMVDDLIGSDN